MKFQPSKRFLAITGSVVLTAALIAGFSLAAPRLALGGKERALIQQIESKPEAKEAYAAILEHQKKKAGDADNPTWYIAIGNNWVLIGDLLGNQTARDKAIAEYEQGIARLGKKNTTLINNAGNAYRASGRYGEAEAKYRQAIEANSGEPTAYENLIDLYRMDLKKPPAEIIKVFQLALDRLIENARIIQLLAEYLVSVGRERDALQYYYLLEKRHPEQFASVIADLERKVNQEKK
ncbi:hypothetical protein EPN90_03075 [Patescibacteria group bacterium]|nr:MAG: hypothetical protein EPN90_03075 [Patescibacteria group bacterium]